MKEKNIGTKCVLCGKVVEANSKYYIEDSGQFCRDCFNQVK